MLLQIVLAIWGCMWEWDPNCSKDYFDMSNAASTWIGLIAGGIIAIIITWWVYNRQNKTSEKQERIIEDIDKVVKKMERQEEMHRAHQEKILNTYLAHQEKILDTYRAHQEKILDKILRLDCKIDSILEKKDK